MITKEQFKAQGITVSNDLIGNAALEWLKKNTTLPIDLNEVAVLDALPFSAKLFISKYDEIISAQDEICKENSDFIMLTDIATELNKMPEFMHPQIGGHYSAKGLEKLGSEGAKTLAASIFGTNK